MRKPPAKIELRWTPQFYGVNRFRLAWRECGDLIAATHTQSLLRMTTFNKIFTTQRLLQIILVLSATVIMKLLS
jgi:hypothetical protein